MTHHKFDLSSKHFLIPSNIQYKIEVSQVEDDDWSNAIFKQTQVAVGVITEEFLHDAHNKDQPFKTKDEAINAAIEWIKSKYDQDNTNEG